MTFWPSHAREQESLEMKVDHTTVLVSFLIILVNSKRPFNSMKNSYRFAEPLVMFMVRLLLITALVLII